VKFINVIMTKKEDTKDIYFPIFQIKNNPGMATGILLKAVY
jgi:hypothetical protein